METKDRVLTEIAEKVETYNNKLKFSFFSLLFFIGVFLFVTFSPNFSHIFSYICGVIILVFVQQIIRSYNYIKFFKLSYNAHEILYDMYDK